jgi:hypothetical protein
LIAEAVAHLASGKGGWGGVVELVNKVTYRGKDDTVEHFRLADAQRGENPSAHGFPPSEEFEGVSPLVALGYRKVFDKVNRVVDKLVPIGNVDVEAIGATVAGLVMHDHSAILKLDELGGQVEE